MISLTATILRPDGIFGMDRFGLVLAEANAAGVPVIAMDLGSCREVTIKTMVEAYERVYSTIFDLEEKRQS